MDNDKKEKEIKLLNIKDVTTCDATAQMLRKAEKDGVETAFHRAASMKACPIGADSACCKHCSMGPCRLVSKDTYGKVGVCGATIDTIQSRNFARMVAAGGAAHTDHGMAMLDLFRDVCKKFVHRRHPDFVKHSRYICFGMRDIGHYSPASSLRNVS